MASYNCHIADNPLLQCDAEPPLWTRQDPYPYHDYVSMEELITHNNLRLAEHREKHYDNSFRINSSGDDAHARSFKHAKECARVAFFKAEIVRNIVDKATRPRKGHFAASFVHDRSNQGQRNRTAFFSGKRPDLRECLRDNWLYQDALGRQGSLNKALPPSPAEDWHPSQSLPSPTSPGRAKGHQRNKTAPSEPAIAMANISANDCYPSPLLPKSRSTGLEYTQENLDRWNGSYVPSPYIFSQAYGPQSTYNQQPAANYHDPSRETITVCYRDSGADYPSPTDVDLNSPEANMLDCVPEVHYSSPDTERSSFESPSTTPEQLSHTTLSRSSSVPANLNIMSDRQKARLEAYRQSKMPTHSPTPSEKLPPHVIVARSRKLNQSGLNLQDHTESRDTLRDKGTPDEIERSQSPDPSAPSSPKKATSPKKIKRSKLKKNLKLARQKSIPRLHRKRSDSISCEVNYEVRSEVASPADSASPNMNGVFDGAASSDGQSPNNPNVGKVTTEIETDPLALQRKGGPPLKKMFGEGGWLGGNDEEKKPSVKSFWGAMRSKAHRAKPSVDFKNMFTVRSKDPASGMVTSNFIISCDPEFQSMLYARHDLLVCTVANRFLMDEYNANRITPLVAGGYIERWVALGRAQFTEFNCGQPFQALIIWGCRDFLQFHGQYDARIRNAVLDIWQKNANQAAVLTRCNGDSAIQKHLQDSWKILEMLGASWYDFDTLSKLHIAFHEKVAAAKERNDALGVPHDWNPPPVPKTPKELPMPSPEMPKRVVCN